jgi:hypothetical protein
MQHPNDELEKLFSERFSDFEAPVPDDAFDAIQKRINAPRPNANKRWYWLAAALLLLISTCSYLKYSGNQSSNLNNQAATNTTEINNQASAQKNDVQKNVQHELQKETLIQKGNVQNVDNQIINNKNIVNKKENINVNQFENNTAPKAKDIQKNTPKDALLDNKTSTIDVNKTNVVENIVNNNVTSIENIQMVVTSKIIDKLVEPKTENQPMREATSTPEKINTLFPNPLTWVKGPSQITLPTVAGAIPKKPRKQIPIAFDYSAAAMWTSYAVSNNVKDHILINQIVVPSATSAKRFGLRVGVGANIQLTKNLTFQNQLSAQIAQISMDYFDSTGYQNNQYHAATNTAHCDHSEWFEVSIAFQYWYKCSCGLSV